MRKINRQVIFGVTSLGATLGVASWLLLRGRTEPPDVARFNVLLATLIVHLGTLVALTGGGLPLVSSLEPGEAGTAPEAAPGGKSKARSWLAWGCAVSAAMVALYLALLFVVLTPAGAIAFQLAGVVLLGAYALRLARRGGPLEGHLLRPATRIDALTPGEVEVHGVLSAEQPLAGMDGHMLALVQVQVRSIWRPRGPKAAPRIEVKQELRLGTGLWLKDGGLQCGVDGAGALVFAEPRVESFNAALLSERASAYESMANPDAFSFEVTERAVPQGGSVVLAGQASLAHDGGEARFRENAAHHRLGGAGERPLVVLVGREVEVLRDLRRQRWLLAALLGASALFLAIFPRV